MITKIYFKEPLPGAKGVSLKFAGRGIHASDGFVIEELSESGYEVRVSHPKHGSWDVRDIRYEAIHDDRPPTLSEAQLVRMGLTPELIGADIDKVHESARPTIKNFCSNIGSFVDKGYGLVLAGAPGVGKSQAAAILAKEAWYVTASVYFVTLTDLLEGARSKINFDAQTSMFERCRDVRFLVLDGMCAEDARNPFIDAHALAGLVEHRDHRRLSTVVTTRMSPKEMAEAFSHFTGILRAQSPMLRVEGENRHALRSEVAKSTILKR